jgi:DNA-binding MarR family transcriptional regulator
VSEDSIISGRYRSDRRLGDVNMDKELNIELIEYQIAILLRRATFSSRKFGGLDRAAYLLLRQLSDHGPVGVKTLADEFHLDVSTVSRQVTALEFNGYIQRLPDPDDHRASNFRLTDTGLRKLSEAKTERVFRFAELLKEWSPEDSQKFSELLSRLNRTFLD